MQKRCSGRSGVMFVSSCFSLMNLPDEVTPEDIRLLSDADFRALVGRLCEEELRKLDLSTSAVSSGGHQDAKDGGLDVVVQLEPATRIEGWIPQPSTGFQVKR